MLAGSTFDAVTESSRILGRAPKSTRFWEPLWRRREPVPVTAHRDCRDGTRASRPQRRERARDQDLLCNHCTLRFSSTSKGLISGSPVRSTASNSTAVCDCERVAVGDGVLRLQLGRTTHSPAGRILHRDRKRPPQSHTPQRLRLVAPIDANQAVVRLAEIDVRHSESAPDGTEPGAVFVVSKRCGSDTVGSDGANSKEMLPFG